MTENEGAHPAIHNIVTALVTAWNQHDARAFAQQFTEDADFTNVFGMVMKGRAAIEASHTPIFKTMFKDSHLRATDTTIRLIRPDVVAVDIRWEMTGARDPFGKEWPARQGLLNMIATDRNGTWSVDVLHNMDLPEQEFAKAQAELLRAANQA